MTSTSSQNRKRFNAVLAQALKKQWIYFAIIASVTVFALIIISVSEIFDMYSEYDVAENMNYALMIASAACLIFSFFTAPRLFKETFKKQQCDIYFSLPVKRSEYFVANYISGLITNFAVYLICVLSVVIRSTMYPNKAHTDIKSIIIFCVVMLLSIILAYTAFILCTVVSGKRVHYILVSLLLMVSTTYALNGFIGKLNTIWGFYTHDITDITSIFSSNILYYLENYIYFDSYYIYTYTVALIIYMAVFTAIVFALAFFCFKNRKAEIAQTSLSGKAVPLVLLVIFIASAFFYGDSWGKKYIGIILGIILCLICGLVYSAVFFKKPYTKQSAIVTACTAVVCAIISIVPIMPSQLRGFEKIVPEASEVESVTLRINDEYCDEYISYLGDEELADELKFTSADAIEKVVAYNNAICEDEVIEKSKEESNIALLRTLFFDGYLDYFNSSHNYILFEYKLKNGRTVRKFYNVADGLKKDEFVQFLMTDDVFDSIEFFNLKQEDILDSSIKKYKFRYKAGEKDEFDNEYEEDVYVPYPCKKEITDLSELKNAYRKDISKLPSSSQIPIMTELAKIYYIGYESSAIDIGHSGYTYYDDIYGDSTYKYQIDVFYYRKNISEKDRKAIEGLTNESKKALFGYVDTYNEFYDDSTSSKDSAAVKELKRLSKFVGHEVFVVCDADKNLSAYMDSLPETK